MDSLFFWISKLAWIIISPLNFILLFIVLAWIMLLFNKLWQAKLLFSCIVILLTLIILFPFGQWLLSPLERRFETNPELPEAIEGIIVLAGAMDPVLSKIWNQTEIHGAVERDLTFMYLARLYSHTKLIYSGGSSSLINQNYKEADAAKAFFEKQGFDTSRIIFERNSRNTYENAEFSLKTANPDIRKKWILITSAYHMPRSVGVFCKLGWNVLPYPVDHKTGIIGFTRKNINLAANLGDLDTALHEWLGLLAYYLTDKTSSLFPVNCNY